MKKNLKLILIPLLFVGCSVNDFSPEVVIPKAIGKIDKTKNEIYLSTNKGFLDRVLKKQDITEEEYFKLKDLWEAAMRAGEYDIAKKIANFEPFKKRAFLEKNVYKLLKNLKYNKKINYFDVFDSYNKYLYLANKYHMQKLYKKLKGYYSDIYSNYKLYLYKRFNYLMATGFYKKEPVDYIKKIVDRLTNVGYYREAKVLLKSYLTYNIKESEKDNLCKLNNSIYSLLENKILSNAEKEKIVFNCVKDEIEKNVDINLSNFKNVLSKINLEKLKKIKKYKLKELEKIKTVKAEYKRIKNKLSLNLNKKVCDVNLIKDSKQLLIKMERYSLNKEINDLQELVKKN